MKRLTAFLLVLVLIASVCSVCAFAQPAEPGPVLHSGRFFERFLSFYKISEQDVMLYDEEYTHYTDSGDESTVDWVIVRAIQKGGIMPAYYNGVIGSRFIQSTNVFTPFSFGYGLYDAKEDKFVPFDTSMTGANVLDLSLYDGLEEVFNTIELHEPAHDLIKDAFYYQNQDGIKEGGSCTAKVLGFHLCSEKTWALVEAHAETTYDYMKEDPLSVRIGRKKLISRESSWPYDSKLAVCLPYETSGIPAFYALDQTDLSDYEGLEDMIMAQDLDSLGFDVVSAFDYEESFVRQHYSFFTVEEFEEHVDLGIFDYDELFYHHDESGEVDWALIYNSLPPEPWEAETGCVIGDRLLVNTIGASAFYSSCWGVYDVKTDTFIDCAEVDEAAYDGLSDAVNALKLGYELGDADRDGVLSVMDATKIQKMLAGIAEQNDIYYSKGSLYSDRIYLSDVDRDGCRTIMDATRIQKILAGLVDRHGETDTDYLTTGAMPLMQDSAEIKDAIPVEVKYSNEYRTSNVDWDRPLDENMMQAALITSYTQFRAFYDKTMSYYYNGFFDENALIDINVNLSEEDVFKFGYEVGVDGSALQVKLTGKIIENAENRLPNKHVILAVKKSDIADVKSIRLWNDFQ